MAYFRYNANPSDNHISDCTARALSVLTNRSWRDVYLELSELSSRVGYTFSDVPFIEDYLDERYERECHYAKTVGEFAREHPYGRYAVTMPSHITAIIDGIIVDTFDPSRSIMRCAWRIDK